MITVIFVAGVYVGVVFTVLFTLIVLPRPRRDPRPFAGFTGPDLTYLATVRAGLQVQRPEAYVKVTDPS